MYNMHTHRELLLLLDDVIVAGRFLFRQPILDVVQVTTALPQLGVQRFLSK